MIEMNNYTLSEMAWVTLGEIQSELQNAYDFLTYHLKKIVKRVI